MGAFSEFYSTSVSYSWLLSTLQGIYTFYSPFLYCVSQPRRYWPQIPIILSIISSQIFSFSKSNYFSVTFYEAFLSKIELWLNCIYQYSCFTRLSFLLFFKTLKFICSCFNQLRKDSITGLFKPLWGLYIHQDVNYMS